MKIPKYVLSELRVNIWTNMTSKCFSTFFLILLCTSWWSPEIVPSFQSMEESLLQFLCWSVFKKFLNITTNAWSTMFRQEKQKSPHQTQDSREQRVEINPRLGQEAGSNPETWIRHIYLRMHNYFHLCQTRVHKLELRSPGEISTTTDKQMILF